MSESRGSEYWREQIQAQRDSGLNAAGYCRLHGVSAWSFYDWRRRLEQKTAAVRLIPVTISDDAGIGRAALLTAGIEVRLASGLVLGLSRDFDALTLQRAVMALR